MTDTNKPPGATEPKCTLLVMCAECGQGFEVRMPLDRDTLARQLAQHGGFLSVLPTPKQGPEVPILFGAVCAECAPTVFPPEVLKIAEERRQLMLRSVPESLRGREPESLRGRKPESR